jgi:hypothetical protein
MGGSIFIKFHNHAGVMCLLQKKKEVKFLNSILFHIIDANK